MELEAKGWCQRLRLSHCLSFSLSVPLPGSLIASILTVCWPSSLLPQKDSLSSSRLNTLQLSNFERKGLSSHYWRKKESMMVSDWPSSDHKSNSGQ